MTSGNVINNGPLWPDMPYATRQLSKGEALDLLARVSVGRVAFTQDALPVIRTVAHIVDEATIVIRTHLGTDIVSHATASGAVVAYQADNLGPARRLGWSVAVTGVAQIVHDPDLAAGYATRLRPLTADAAADQFLFIQPTIVTGYVLCGPPLTADLGAAPSIAGTSQA
jgi:hypothetical protein